MSQWESAPGLHLFSTCLGDVLLRPDLGCYLLLPCPPTSPHAELQPLHPSLCGGHHYLGSRWHRHVTVVKGDQLLETEDLSMEPVGQAQPLHPSCHGGQRYLAIPGGFLIFFQDSGTIRAVRDLATGEPDTDLCLRSQGWTEEKGGVRSYLYWHLWDDAHGSFFSLHPSVLSFLPGGLALTIGAAFGAWELVQTLHNYSDSPITQVYSIFCMVGCAVEKLANVGCNWKVSMPDYREPGAIAKALAKAQFSLPACYGGVDLSTEVEDWDEAREEEKCLQLPLTAQETLYVWQYQLGLGKEAILFCRDIMITSSPDPPLEAPLPPSF